MPIRIESLRVHRDGPLKEDFQLEPRLLNLVYGSNETGKTYLVEALLRFLFKPGKGRDWGLREWSPGGRAIVSGLSDKPLSFTKSGAGLERVWLEAKGLPQDLARLLTVRAGETRLSDDAACGVGRGMMKSFLSGERLLDRLEEGIPVNVRKSSVTGGTILSQRREGDLKRREDLLAELGRLRTLLGRVDDDEDQGAARGLTTRIRGLSAELAALQAGRRHQAFLLDSRLRELRLSADALPDAEEMTAAETDAREFVNRTDELSRRRQDLEDLGRASSDYSWTRNAVEEYARVSLREGGRGGRKPAAFLVAALCLAGAVAAGLFDQALLAVGLGAAAIGLLLWDRRGSRSAAPDAAREAEMEAIRRGYLERFSAPLESLTDLRAKADELLHSHTRAELVQRGILELEAEVTAIGARVRAFFKECGIHCGGVDSWKGHLAELRGKRVALEWETGRLEHELAALGVPRGSFLPDPPETVWDPEREASCRRALEEAEADLRRRNGSLSNLRAEVAGLTGLDATAPWERLREALSDLLDAKAAEYRTLTASILAGICVSQAVGEFKAQERTRVEEGLARPEITDPVTKLTGGGGRLTLDESWELVLTGPDGDEWPLGRLSTGVLEQIHIALRTGFARIALDDAAFLILDDAFQHSDWRRRRHLVEYTVGLVREGWQVFYFTMDDHIRGLFEEAGAALGADFASVSLG